MDVKRFALLGLMLLTASDAVAASRTCGGSAVTMRSAPSGHAESVGDLDDGASLTVLEEGGAWTRVEDAQGRTGWISSTSVCSDDDANGAESPSIARWRNPIAGACVTSPFGPRRRPTRGASRNHKGCDFGAGCGTPVKSAAPGRVIAAGWSGGYGKRVIVQHPDGTKSLYAHLRRINVRPGATLSSSTVLGEVGTTGVSTGCHLHFEIHVSGRQVNPQSYIGSGSCPTSGRSTGSPWNAGTPR